MLDFVLGGCVVGEGALCLVLWQRTRRHVAERRAAERAGLGEAVERERFEKAWREESERRQLLEQQLDRAEHDPRIPVLPGEQRWRRQAEAMLAQRRGVALAVVGIDDFRTIRHKFGLRGGDWVLARVAERLGEVFGDDALVGRIGGDDFAVVMTRTVTSESLRFRLEEEYPWQRGGIRVAVSVGITELLDQHVNDLTKRLEQADQAMIAARRAGDGLVRFWYRGRAVDEHVFAHAVQNAVEL